MLTSATSQLSRSYFTVTEVPGFRATLEQLSMLSTRYHWAATYAEGKDVLEVACGSGIGLGYLARRAKRVVGGDIDETNLAFARETYKNRANIEICSLDAEALPFKAHSFDTVLLFEAVYYLSEPKKFFSEARRVLRTGGSLLIVSVNPEWPGFNPSPFSVQYYSAKDLIALLSQQGFQPQVFCAFPDKPDSLSRKLIARIRRLATSLHLIPKTMKGKEWLKRIFLGRLELLQAELREEGMVAPVSLSSWNVSSTLAIRVFKVLYAVGTITPSSP
jgi:ubiquinone/menaquinone biosynthesis C-methylase UbiE